MGTNISSVDQTDSNVPISPRYHKVVRNRFFVTLLCGLSPITTSEAIIFYGCIGYSFIQPSFLFYFPSWIVGKFEDQLFSPQCIYLQRLDFVKFIYLLSIVLLTNSKDSPQCYLYTLTYVQEYVCGLVLSPHCMTQKHSSLQSEYYSKTAAITLMTLYTPIRCSVPTLQLGAAMNQEIDLCFTPKTCRQDQSMDFYHFKERLFKANHLLHIYTDIPITCGKKLASSTSWKSNLSIIELLILILERIFYIEFFTDLTYLLCSLRKVLYCTETYKPTS